MTTGWGSIVASWAFTDLKASSAPSKIRETALWVTTLNSTRGISSIAPVITQDQINYNDPRTFGVQLVAHF